LFPLRRRVEDRQHSGGVLTDAHCEPVESDHALKPPLPLCSRHAKIASGRIEESSDAAGNFRRSVRHAVRRTCCGTLSQREAEQRCAAWLAVPPIGPRGTSLSFRASMRIAECQAAGGGRGGMLCLEQNAGLRATIRKVLAGPGYRRVEVADAAHGPRHVQSLWRISRRRGGAA